MKRIIVSLVALVALGATLEAGRPSRVIIVVPPPAVVVPVVSAPR